MTNTVPRPPFFNSMAEMENHFWSKDDPLAQGPQGPQGETGPQGEPGPRGPEGQAVRIRWIVASALDLPASNIEVGDGALVGASAPYTLYVYTNDPPQWNNVGPVTQGPAGEQGPQGIQGPQGPAGPQPPLAGAGSATTAAKSDHTHANYSLTTHKHDSDYAAKAMEGKIANIDYSLDGGGTWSATYSPSYIRLRNGLRIEQISGNIAVLGLDFSKVSVPGHTHTTADITAGAFHIDRIPAIPADKISGALSSSQVPLLNASKIAAGTFSPDRIPKQTLNATLPATTTLTSVVSSFRVGPANTHAVIQSFGATNVHDTGMRVTTDEPWAYVLHPVWGFGWIQASRIP